MNAYLPTPSGATTTKSVIDDTRQWLFDAAAGAYGIKANRKTTKNHKKQLLDLMPAVKSEGFYALDDAPTTEIKILDYAQLKPTSDARILSGDGIIQRFEYTYDGETQSVWLNRNYVAIVLGNVEKGDFWVNKARPLSPIYWRTKTGDIQAMIMPVQRL
jgi:hypothetical protein